MNFPHDRAGNSYKLARLRIPGKTSLIEAYGISCSEKTSFNKYKNNIGLVNNLLKTGTYILIYCQIRSGSKRAGTCNIYNDLHVNIDPLLVTLVFKCTDAVKNLTADIGIEKYVVNY